MLFCIRISWRLLSNLIFSSGLLNSSSKCFDTESLPGGPGGPGGPALATPQARAALCPSRARRCVGSPRTALQALSGSFVQIQIDPFHDFNRMTIRTITGGKGSLCTRGPLLIRSCEPTHGSLQKDSGVRWKHRKHTHEPMHAPHPMGRHRRAPPLHNDPPTKA